jgi:hypothetical protein
MKLINLWPILLLAAFIVGILGAAITGDVRCLALSVIPAAIFARWMKV